MVTTLFLLAFAACVGIALVATSGPSMIGRGF
jgi:UPF0716 family protein affecting phage T7 exclusion